MEMKYFFRVKCKLLKRKERQRDGLRKKEREKREISSRLCIYPLYTMEIMITGKFADISERERERDYDKNIHSPIRFARRD